MTERSRQTTDIAERGETSPCNFRTPRIGVLPLSGGGPLIFSGLSHSKAGNRKIRIGGAERSAALGGQCGQRGILDQVAGALSPAQQFRRGQCSVLGSRRGRRAAPARRPFWRWPCDSPRAAEEEQPWMGGDPAERQELTGHAKPSSSVLEHCIQPAVLLRWDVPQPNDGAESNRVHVASFLQGLAISSSSTDVVIAQMRSTSDILWRRVKRFCLGLASIWSRPLAAPC